jgi:hypothetical protein
VTSVNNDSAVGPQLYAMKKATEVQANAVLKVLESSGVPQQGPQNSGAALTGVGQKLDIKA